MDTSMLVSFLLLGALVACARADCDACVSGQCYSRKTLIQGLPITDQLAIDQTNNVLYTQINSYLNTAFFLDDNKIQLVQMQETSGMAVDQYTQTLYTSADVTKTFFKYDLISNVSETLTAKSTKYIYPGQMLLRYGDGHLHFIDRTHRSVQYVNETDGAIWQKRSLKNYFISDFVIDRDNNYFFVSNSTVYMYNDTQAELDELPAVVFGKSHVLSVDNFGDVYFGDATEKVIRKRDGRGNMGVYATYTTGALADFVFERNNDIVFRDVDGSVVRWNHTPGQTCKILPPHDGYVIVSHENSCNK